MKSFLSDYKTDLLAILVVIVLAFLVLLSISPHLQPAPGTDSGIFLYIGEIILEGGTVYQDGWDHKGPLIFYINAFAQMLRQDSLWGIWLLQWLAVGSASLLGYALVRKTFGPLPALFGSVLWLIALSSVIDGGNLTEIYALPFQFLCLWFFAMGETRDRKSDSFFIGIAAAIAFWLRANIIGIPIAIGLVYFIRVLSKRNKESWSRLSFLMVGFATVSTIILVYFYLQNNLAPMLEATFTYNMLYSSSTVQQRWGVIIHGIARVGTLGLFGLAGWILGTVNISSERRIPQNGLVAVIALAIPLDLILVSLSGKPFHHYYMSILPSLSVASAYFISKMLASNGGQPTQDRQYKDRGFNNRAAIVLILVLLFLPLRSLLPVASATLSDALANGGVPRVDVMNSYYGPLLDYMTKNLDPGKDLVVWGKDSSINWLSGHKVPSRFLFQEHFLVDEYVTREMIDSYISDLSSARPYIIDHTAGRDWLAPAVDTPLEQLPFNVQPLYLYLHTDYCFVEYIEPYNWPIYEYCGKTKP